MFVWKPYFLCKNFSENNIRLLWEIISRMSKIMPQFFFAIGSKIFEIIEKYYFSFLWIQLYSVFGEFLSDEFEIKPKSKRNSRFICQLLSKSRVECRGIKRHLRHTMIAIAMASLVPNSCSKANGDVNA